MSELLTRSDAARQLGISTDTLDRLRKGGKIAFVQHVKGGKVWFTEDAIREYLARSTHAVQTAPSQKGTFRKVRAAQKGRAYA